MGLLGAPVLPAFMELPYLPAPLGSAVALCMPRLLGTPVCRAPVEGAFMLGAAIGTPVGPAPQLFSAQGLSCELTDGFRGFVTGAEICSCPPNDSNRLRWSLLNGYGIGSIEIVGSAWAMRGAGLFIAINSLGSLF